MADRNSECGPSEWDEVLVTPFLFSATPADLAECIQAIEESADA